jgi:hypothetical protein
MLWHCLVQHRGVVAILLDLALPELEMCPKKQFRLQEMNVQCLLLREQERWVYNHLDPSMACENSSETIPTATLPIYLREYPHIAKQCPRTRSYCSLSHSWWTIQ